MLISYKRGQGSIVLRVKILNSSVSTGAGLTGLTSASTGLIIGTIADNENASTAYTVAGSTIETITTLGTYAAPTATKCRFKEVDSTNHPGIYEIQLADARYAVSSAKSLIVSISGATNAAQCDATIPLRDLDPYDAVRAGLTALPNVASGSAGAIITAGTGTAQLSVSSGIGQADLQTIKTQAVSCSASVTVGPFVGNSTAAISVDASGKLLLQATQSGVTIPTVTTVTNQLTAAAIATGVWQDATASDFTTASSIGRSLYTSGNVPGAANGLFIAGTNAATTVNLTSTITGSLSGSVGSVTGAVGSVTGSVGSVAGNVSGSVGSVAGNVTGSVGSIASGGIAAASFAAGAINAAAIADAAIDRATFANDTGLVSIRSGTAQAGSTSSTIVLDSGASATNNLYQNQIVTIVSGTGVGESAMIASYVGSTKVATINGTWATTPDATSVFVITAFGAISASVSGSVTVGGYSAGQDPGTYVLATPSNKLATDASGRVDLGKVLGTAVTLDANNVLNVSAKYWAGTAITAASIPVATAAGASGGLLISGTNSGTVTLGALAISGATTLTGNVSMSAGLNITQSTLNASALVVTGNGTGHGGLFTSGSGATGSGLKAISAATDGNGFDGVGFGTGDGVSGTGGSNGHGYHGVGGGNGAGFFGFGVDGFRGLGSGSGHGLALNGGSAGYGTHIIGGTGRAGVRVEGGSGNSNAVEFAKTGSGIDFSAPTTDMVLAKTTNITGFNDLDAAGVRTAVGLASANLDTQFSAIPTSAQITTAVLTTQMTESYAADGTAPTLAQAQFLTMQSMHEFSINGVTRTVKKLDGTTTAATFTLDSSTAPTSTTRAT